MSWEEFQLLPAHPGWKREYWDGMAHISPRSLFAVLRLDVQPRAIQTPVQLRTIDQGDEPGLISAYLDSFRDTVEYCDWDQDAILRSARDDVRTFYAGNRGEVLSASCVALDPAAADPVDAVAGAALLTRTEDRIPTLDMLLVRPCWQRRGLATALVSWSLEELHREGEVILRSCYHLANEPSRAWHRKFGFVEEPDLRIARVYLRCARQELWRLEKAGVLGEAERSRLLGESERWESQVGELERIAAERGIEAVSPMIRLH